jgi:hypothetical protein
MLGRKARFVRLKEKLTLLPLILFLPVNSHIAIIKILYSLYFIIFQMFFQGFSAKWWISRTGGKSESDFIFNFLSSTTSDLTSA